MAEGERVQRSIAEHVLWCCKKRDELTKELAECRDGISSIGERKAGEPMTQSAVAHIALLQRAIDQLGKVIDVYAPPTTKYRRAN